MFKINKYHKWYFSIINNAKNRKLNSYSEKHHIIPNSFGGDKSDENIIKLTPREHFICHLLLVRMTDGMFQKKMIRAANAMIYYRSKNRTISPEFKSTSKLYQKLKEQFSEIMKGKRSDETKKKMSDSAKARIRKPLSEAHKLAIAKGRTGKKHDQATKEKIAEAANKKFQSEDARKKLSDAVKSRMADPEIREKFLDGMKLRDENIRNKKLALMLDICG